MPIYIYLLLTPLFMCNKVGQPGNIYAGCVFFDVYFIIKLREKGFEFKT